MPRSKLTHSVKPAMVGPAAAAPAQQHIHTVTGGPSFFDSIKMGAGMSIGQRLVGAFSGIEIRHAPVETASPIDPCAAYRTALDACLKQASPHDSCESRIALYKECLEKKH